ncbi:hypothetical protein BASA81_000362 [Batrachochytrium salamandrivorans]|nr:hypothetical protein BASA81_000362 [Batrachochytrium salamandrivorans]
MVDENSTTPIERLAECNKLYNSVVLPPRTPSPSPFGVHMSYARAVFFPARKNTTRTARALNFPPTKLTTTMRLVFVVLLACHSSLAKSLGGWGEFFLVRQANGQVFAAGANNFGQLGLGTVSAAVPLPELVGNANNVSDLSAATIHSCVVDQNGQAKCVGSDMYGQLGRGASSSQASILAPVVGLETGVAQVYCGPGATCALLTNGGARCWGWNSGNLGDGTMDNRNMPSTVVGFQSRGLIDIAVGSAHTCFLTATGRVACTGYNLLGQIGTGTADNYLAPQLVASSLVFSSVSAGYWHSCAANSDTVQCWGAGMYGQLGAGGLANLYALELPNAQGLTSYTYHSRAPVQVLLPPGANPKAVTSSNHATFVLLRNGSVVGFGQNLYGALGNGNTKFQTTPVAFRTSNVVKGSIVEVRGGYFTTCAVDDLGEVYCVGSNLNGQMAVGASISTSLKLLKMKVPQPRTSTRQPTVKRPVTKTPTKRPVTKTPTKRPATKTPTKRPAK